MATPPLRKNGSPARRRRCQKLQAAARAAGLCEELESRTLLSTNLGVLPPGRLFLADQTIKGTFTSNGGSSYTFSLAAAADVTIFIPSHLLGSFWMGIEGGAT